MAWVRIDDQFDEHPKFARVGPLGMALWVTGLAYCNRNLTDGFIPWSVARNLVNWEYLGPEEEDGRQRVYTVSVTSGMHGEDVSCKTIIPLLVEAGLWDEVDGGYQVHDYDQYQPSKEKVMAERAANAERQQKYRDRQSGRYTGKSNGDSNGVTNAGRNSVSNDRPVPVPDPVPSSPNGEDIPPTPKRRKKCKSLTPEQLTRFERWYSVFPRKVNRAKAEEKWAEIDPDDELTDVMVSKTEEWAASPDWTKDGGQYVPHPATWLHNKRWTDGAPSKEPAPGSLTVHNGGITDIRPGPRGYTMDQLRQKAEMERLRESS